LVKYFTEKFVETGKSVAKFTEWTIEICGALPVVGKRLASGFQIDKLSGACFTSKCTK